MQLDDLSRRARGGGLLVAERRLWRNHRPDEAEAHPSHRPRGLDVEPNPEAHGEDEPIYQRRLARDGWEHRYRERFRIDGASNEPELPPGPLEWLDWDPGGRLIALSGGRVWAAVVADRNVARFSELLDLRGDRPEPREAPDSARRW